MLQQVFAPHGQQFPAQLLIDPAQDSTRELPRVSRELARISHHLVSVDPASTKEYACHPEGSTKSYPKDLNRMFTPRCGSDEILRFAQDDNASGIGLESTRFGGEKCGLVNGEASWNFSGCRCKEVYCFGKENIRG